MKLLNLFKRRKTQKHAEKEYREMVFESTKRISHCFLLVSTQITDTEEDEKDDGEHYNNYKQKHPSDGTAIWNNKRGSIKYIYINGKEKIYHISQKNDLTAIEDEMKAALNVLHSQEAKDNGIGIVNGYDYAYIKLVIDKDRFNGSERLKDTMPGFIKLIKRLGFDDICDSDDNEKIVNASKTLNKYYSQAFPSKDKNDFSWTYTDTKGKSPSERNRRNRLVKTFTEQMRMIRGVS